MTLEIHIRKKRNFRRRLFQEPVVTALSGERNLTIVDEIGNRIPCPGVTVMHGLRDEGAAQDKDVARNFARIPFKPVDPYTAECAYFADCVLNRRQPKINNAKNALHIMALTEKAYASYKAKSLLTV